MARLLSSSRALYILEDIDVLAERIRHASEELRALRDVRGVASPAFDRPRVSGSRRDDAMVSRLASIERYEAELMRNIDLWIRRQKEADEVISYLHDAEQMRVLHMRYVEGRPVSYIADSMFYSCKTIYAIMHRALDALDGILEARAEAERSSNGRGPAHDTGESENMTFQGIYDNETEVFTS